MQKEKQQQPWRINIYARSKHFSLKIRAKRTLPFSSWNFHRLSVLLTLHKFILQLKSESPVQQRPSLKSKFDGAFQKLRIRLPKKRSVPPKQTFNLPYPDTKPSTNLFRLLAYKEPVCISSLVLGIPAFIFGFKKYVTSVILLWLAISLEKNTSGRSTTALAFSLVATVFFSTVFHLNGFMNYDRVHGYIAEFVLEAWNFICSAASNKMGYCNK